MNRWVQFNTQLFKRVPRAYGDEPPRTIESITDDKCSPCLRGWTELVSVGIVLPQVFPVLTGMNRGINCDHHLRTCVPRAYGDEPLACSCCSLVTSCSPCLRGWTVLLHHQRIVIDVFPVLTGMNRLERSLSIKLRSVPRAYGDEPLCYIHST